MTKFIDVPTICRIVNKIGTGEFIAGMAATVREDFKRWESFDKSARLAAHSDEGVIELMPIADNEQYAFKYVNGHPLNPEKGLSTVMAFGALANVDSGYPTLISELTLTTAFRTAATSAVAASALARPDSKIMGMIGCGAQSEFQAIAFHQLLGIETIRIFDTDSAAMAKTMRNLGGIEGLEIVAAETAKEAVRGADIVTTCTADKAWATILTADMIEPGMHINGVGGDCPGKTELHVDVLRMAKIFVEYEPQTRVEGDIQQLPADHPVNDLWRVIAGIEKGRDNEDQITIFDSVGFAMEDYSALRYVKRMADELNEGEMVKLIPDLADPKDLFKKIISSDGRVHIRKAA
jgi:ornithine cyclodeaminase